MPTKSSGKPRPETPDRDCAFDAYGGSIAGGFSQQDSTRIALETLREFPYDADMRFDVYQHALTKSAAKPPSSSAEDDLADRRRNRMAAKE